VRTRSFIFILIILSSYFALPSTCYRSGTGASSARPSGIQLGTKSSCTLNTLSTCRYLTRLNFQTPSSPCSNCSSKNSPLPDIGNRFQVRLVKVGVGIKRHIITRLIRYFPDLTWTTAESIVSKAYEDGSALVRVLNNKVHIFMNTACIHQILTLPLLCFLGKCSGHCEHHEKCKSPCSSRSI
jgi:hypothetical protein